MAVESLSENFVSAKKVKVYDSFWTRKRKLRLTCYRVSSTLESATSWLDIRVLYIRLNSKGGRESMEQRGEQTELQLRS